MIEDQLRFVPKGVEGLPSVAEVAVFPDRLELLSAGWWVTIRLADIARWPWPQWLWRWLARLGLRRGSAVVGERDWFRDQAPDRFFRFYSRPLLTVYMPDEDGVEYGQTLWVRLQEVLMRGRFTTFDLG